MKKFVLPMTLLFAAGVVWAQATKAPESRKPGETKTADTAKMTGKKTHPVEAEVVSTDVEGKKMTVKIEGTENTVPVAASAVSQLKKAKPGDKVVLTCRDNERGEHQEVTAIKPAKGSTAAKTPASSPAERKP